MPTVYQLIRMRRRQSMRDRRRPNSRIGLGCSGLLSLLVALGSLSLALAYASLSRDLPSPEILPAYLEPPNGLLLQPTRLLDRSGEHVLLSLENPAAEERKFLTLDSTQPDFLPDTLIAATLASADPGFWQHPGVSLVGIRSGSHPTLAQQLVVGLLLADEPPGVRRALRERLLAAQVTARFGREKILTWYLNTANYGRLAFGAHAAARVYFGKPAGELTLAESALLAAVAEAPALNPHDAPEAAIARQAGVLERMAEQGRISAKEARAAGREKIHITPPAAPRENIAPVFLNLALSELDDQYDIARLERGGWRVITTLDFDLQTQANCASAFQLARLEQAAADLPPPGASGCPAAGLLPELQLGAGQIPSGLSANTIVLDPVSGQILALTGKSRPEARVLRAGRESVLDLDVLPRRSPGTLLTPFIYLTAFTRGHNPASLVWDIPGEQSGEANLTGTGLNPPVFQPDRDIEYHGPVRLRTALANDYLSPAAQILVQVGPETVWQIARQAGLPLTPASAGRSPLQWLLDGEISLLDAAQAFSMFANQGIQAGRSEGPDQDPNSQPLRPATVLRLEDAAAKTWSEGAAQGRPVISPELAYLVTHVLSDEIARWPSMGHPNSLEVGRPAAAKLGAGPDGRDAWVVGYSPQRVVGVWAGVDAGDGGGPAVPPQAAADLWHAVFAYASRNLAPDGWLFPSRVTTVEVCDPSGMLPGPDCPTTVNEVFLAGSEPVQTDTLFRRLSINRETGRLATVFSPPGLVEERIYLVVPPQAQEWARQAGIPFPPQTYDVIYAQSPSQQAHISSPDLFAAVRGKLSIQGTAGGDGFERYRVQVGEGLNPTGWLRVGPDGDKPVVSGELVVWDTQGLSGLYAIQLLVVGADQRVQTASVQVTVDNQPPTAGILYPAAGQEVFPVVNGLVTFQIQAEDNQEVELVEFFVDDRRVASLAQPPYALPWESSPGGHSLRIRVTDRAGNTAEDRVDFQVEVP